MKKAQFDWKVVLICVLTTACVTLWWGQRNETRAAQNTVHSNDDLIAVTGTYGSGASVLYLVDTKTRHMAVYTSRNGRSVELVAARRIATDLELLSYRDESAPGMTPQALQRKHQRYLTGQTEEVIVEDGDFGPATPITPTDGRSGAPVKSESAPAKPIGSGTEKK